MAKIMRAAPRSAGSPRAQRGRNLQLGMAICPRPGAGRGYPAPVASAVGIFSNHAAVIARGYRIQTTLNPSDLSNFRYLKNAVVPRAGIVVRTTTSVPPPARVMVVR